MSMNKKVILFATSLIALVLLSICIAGPLGLFNRKAGNCANGVCNAPSPEPVPVVVEENVTNILLEVPKRGTQEVVKNDILGCDCTNCTCIKCTCEHCKCKNCQGKPGYVIPYQEIKKDLVKQGVPLEEDKILPDLVESGVLKEKEKPKAEVCEPAPVEYQYYERPRLFRRLFRR